MQCAEDYVRFCCKCVLEECLDDLKFLSKMYRRPALLSSDL
jgi:asparaginyl-tRNA synthetase